ncbi:MAG: NAD+ synthase [Nitrospiria bacterium]
MFRIALAQINSTVGDLKGNLTKITDAIKAARKNQVDLIAFPEMALTGYPPEDLLLKPAFIQDNLQALEEIAPFGKGMTVVVGFVDGGDVHIDHLRENILYNAAAVIHNGALKLIYHKKHLPNYGVFDENRYFHPGKTLPVFSRDGVHIGINICEDIWHAGPVSAQAEAGADLVVNINASPYQAGKSALREEILSTRAKNNGVSIAYVNMVGGQDELVFDGGSLVVDAKGELLARADHFKEALLTVDLAHAHRPASASKQKASSSSPVTTVKKWVFSNRKKRVTRKALTPTISKPASPLEEIYQALVLGLADYVRKNRFKRCVIAISGGIDSALTAAIAVDALGKENITGVFMPSQFTSTESIEDAQKLARNLEIDMIALPIEATLESYLSLLSEAFKNTREDITEENLQARIRGNMMMALSNKFGWLVLTTGNKSEMSVGYATLYGDMAGGFAVIKDLWKNSVYQLAEMRNKKGKAVIPRRTIKRAPTAELRHDQRDQDTLPPYDILDPILKAYVEENRHREEIVAMGYDAAVVSKIVTLVDSSEFKRRQAPVGIKITSRALGKDRRMPITNRYRRTYQKEGNKQDTHTNSRRENIA